MSFSYTAKTVGAVASIVVVFLVCAMIFGALFFGGGRSRATKSPSSAPAELAKEENPELEKLNQFLKETPEVLALIEKVRPKLEEVEKIRKELSEHDENRKKIVERLEEAEEALEKEAGAPRERLEKGLPILRKISGRGFFSW